MRTRADSALSFGLFLSITCSEDVAFRARTRRFAAETQGTFSRRLSPAPTAGGVQAVGRRRFLPTDYRAPIESAVPTLFVSGDADGRDAAVVCRSRWRRDSPITSRSWPRAKAIPSGAAASHSCTNNWCETGTVSGLNPSCPAVAAGPPLQKSAEVAHASVRYDH